MLKQVITCENCGTTLTTRQITKHPESKRRFCSQPCRQEFDKRNGFYDKISKLGIAAQQRQNFEHGREKRRAHTLKLNAERKRGIKTWKSGPKPTK